LGLLSTSSKGYAQFNKSEDIDVIKEYDASNSFDDDETHFAKNLISTNVLSWAVGDFHFNYEYKLSSIIALKFGVGIVDNSGNKGKLLGVMTGIPPHDTSIQNLGYSVAAKFYTNPFPEALYFGIHYRNRPYYRGDIYDLYVNVGYQIVLDSQFLLGVSMGNGFRWINNETVETNSQFNFRSFRKIIPFNFEFGFLF
jgi:hypothetical protein